MGVNILYVKTSIHYNFLQATEKKRKIYSSWQHVVKTDKCNAVGNMLSKLTLIASVYVRSLWTLMRLAPRNANVWLVFVYEHFSLRVMLFPKIIPEVIFVETYKL